MLKVILRGYCNNNTTALQRTKKYYNKKEYHVKSLKPLLNILKVLLDFLRRRGLVADGFAPGFVLLPNDFGKLPVRDNGSVMTSVEEFVEAISRSC